MEYQTEIVPIDSITPNPRNPRTITETQLKRLAKSVKDFPAMLRIRPIVVDGASMIIGGNMRYRAACEIGLTEVPVIRATDLTPEQVREFIVKDNAPEGASGAWDFDTPANEWDTEKLSEWGFDLPSIDDDTVTGGTPSTTEKITLEIEFGSEQEQRAIYDEMTGRGYRCKMTVR